jgi:hypothetical protein
MKIAVLCPAARRWAWHQTLVDALAPFGSVDLTWISGDGYPAALAGLIGLEQALFGRRGHAVRQPAGEGVLASAIDLAAYDLIVDLAQAAPGAAHRLAPSYDGQADERFFWGALLDGRSPFLAVRRGSGETLASSYPAVEDREVLARAAGSLFSRLIALTVRAVETAAGGAPPRLAESSPCAATPANAWRVARFALKEAAIKVRRTARKPFVRERHWTIALRRQLPADAGGQPAMAPFSPLRGDPETYYADPFLFVHAGRTWLFAEAFPYDGRVGYLVAAPLGPDGTPGPFETVLSRPYHLSYPQIFAHDGEVFMVPESGGNHAVEILRATEFPKVWAPHTVLMDKTTLSDPTLFEHGGRWWMLGSGRAYGGSSQDELSAFHAPSPFGPWTAHAANPIKSDARCSRPGGPVMRRDGRLLRPAQDCVDGYGAGLAWCEIQELTPDSFREEVIGRWRGVDFGPYQGVHTYTAAGGFEAIDLKLDLPRR